MSTRLYIIGLVVLLLSGCAGPSDTHTLSRPPILGVVIDENQRVVDVWEGSGALAAGLQVGDVLLDLTWRPSSTPEPAETPISETTPISSDGSTEPVLGASDTPTDTDSGMPDWGPVAEGLAVPAPTTPPEQVLDTTPVSFTDVQGILEVVGYGFPLRIRFERAGTIQELTIVPNTSIYRELGPGESEPTPMAENHIYY